VILNAQQAMPQGGVVEVRADNLPSDVRSRRCFPLGAGSRSLFVIRAAASRRTNCRTSLIPMSPLKPVVMGSASPLLIPFLPSTTATSRSPLRSGSGRPSLSICLPLRTP
jgi:hypothetical protein